LILSGGCDLKGKETSERHQYISRRIKLRGSPGVWRKGLLLQSIAERRSGGRSRRKKGPILKGENLCNEVGRPSWRGNLGESLGKLKYTSLQFRSEAISGGAHLRKIKGNRVGGESQEPPRCRRWTSHVEGEKGVKTSPEKDYSRCPEGALSSINC